MAVSDTQFSEYIAEEVKKYQGIQVPVKASFLERMLVKKAKTSKLHPNPDDEFCSPSVGPNYGIISDYVKTILTYKTLRPDIWDERLVVEKVYPDGYMILNGHHRWAAAIMTGYEPLPISIVNLTQETDIEKMVRESKHDKRVTLDLDEVVFCSEQEEEKENPLPFPYGRLYKERIRRGIPALFHFLSVQGYDIWVYTARYYSFDYIRSYFKHYSAKVDGVITGIARKSLRSEEAKKRVEKLFAGQYKETMHIDRKMVLHTKMDSREYEEYPVNAEPESWALAVMEIVKSFRNTGESDS